MKQLPTGEPRPCIVFGANGYLGSLVTRELHNSGIEVLAVVRPGAEKSRLQNLVDLAVLEAEPSKWPEIVSTRIPTAVICAQWNGVSKEDREDLEKQHINIESIFNLARVAKNLGVESFLCLGSQAEALPSTERIKEIFYDSGKSAYGRAKAKLLSKLDYLFAESHTRFIWARVFSVYGPTDYSESLLTQLFLAENANQELVISNPTKFWSYLYEDDFATALGQILKYSQITGIVNVGNPTLFEIKHIVEVWSESSNSEPSKPKADELGSGFFPELQKLISIGWEPRMSLEDGLRRTREGFKVRFDSKE